MQGMPFMRLLGFSLFVLAAARCGAENPALEGGAPDAAAASPGTDAEPWMGPSAPDGASAGEDQRASADDGGPAAEAGQPDAGVRVAGPSLLRLPSWSVRKHLRPDENTDVVLEEVLAGFGAAVPGQMRIRRLSGQSAPERSWTAPAGSALADFCGHPSGAFSAILVAPDRTVVLQRLSADLSPSGTLVMRDPLIATDPHVTAGGALDLRAHALTNEAAQLASVDEAVVAAVSTSWNSVIAYRASFTGGAWTEPQRTLIEPPAALTPFLPIGGSFDTFGAMVSWFRPLLDVDEAGNAYVAIWANPGRIRTHVLEFHDGLAPLPGDPLGPSVRDSDVLLTRMDRTGARVWSRVVGTTNEDEPYALRVHAGDVAVAGRARRFPGFDNRTWDAFLTVVSSSGAFRGARVFGLDGSGIFLAVDALPGGGWVLAGSDGWAQNPEGLSVLAYGAKLLAVLPAIDGALARVALPAGPRHNEVRTVLARRDRLLFGGHEDGPIMHTGDADPRLIVATGVLGEVSRPGAP
jgi:hypothetical protein